MRRLLAAVTAMFALGIITSARAGVYEVRSCGANSVSAFVLANESPESISASTRCPQNGAQLLSGIFAGVANSGFTLAGSGAEWTIAAPTGLELRRLDLKRSLGRLSSSWLVSASTPARALEACNASDPATCRYGPAGGEATSYVDLNAPSVTFRIECQPPDSSGDLACVGRPSTQAWVAIYSSVALVGDPNPPTVAALSGTLVSPGWQSGAETVDLQASDASGVKSMTLFAGDTKLFERQQSCDYARMQPCPASQHDSPSVDTAKLAEGTYQLRAVATDAADQPGTATGVLKVDATAPAAPTGLVLSRNPDGTYGLTWTNPDQGTAAPIAAARVQVCVGATCGESKVFTGSDIERITSLALPAGEQTVKVWLQDEAGNADAGNAATLTVDPATIEAPNVLQTRPPVLQSGSVAPPKFRVTKARSSGSTLTLSGTIAKGARASITGKLSKAQGAATLASAKAKPKNGKWSLKLKLSSSLRGANTFYVSVSFAGESAFGKSTLRRRLAKQAGRTELSLRSVR
jgi:hypothetical protein